MEKISDIWSVVKANRKKSERVNVPFIYKLYGLHILERNDISHIMFKGFNDVNVAQSSQSNWQSFHKR